MDDTLKELRKIREDVEERFNGVLSQMEEDLGQIHAQIKEIEDAEEDVASANLGKQLSRLSKTVQTYQSRTIEALRESMLLHNARSAELARQLTVLPLERMDLVLDKFERRLEDLEVRLQRLESRE